MEIKINGTPKEIAELALELQVRLMLNLECDSHELAKQVIKGVRVIEAQSQKSDEVDFAAAQKAITDASKKVHEEKSTPKYETREIHIFCGNAIDSNSQNHQVKERTFGDVKKIFEKTLHDLGLSKD